ncbi:oligomeric Golgi complex subunit 7 [Spinellus fusiger]|nr:oligomeric Golgi complex subunit 7 [Spinellus fusiger]
MAHLDALAQKDFDVKKWINASLLDPQTEQSTLVMATLQHTGEHISAKVTQLNHQVLTQLPRLMYEVERLSMDAHITHATLRKVQAHVREHDSHDALERLRQLHLVKTRMEQCQTQLREAENWSQLEKEATKALEKKDYEGCALRLHHAQQSLDVFQHTSEFETRRQLLHTLEQALETHLKPLVTLALQSSDLPKSQALYGVLTRIGRSDTFVDMYLEETCPPLQLQWRAYTAATVTLRAFYSHMEHALTQEYVHCASLFPDPKAVMQALVQRLFTTLDPSLSDQLQSLRGDVQAVVDAFVTTEQFGLALERLLAKPPVSTGVRPRRLSVHPLLSITPLALRHSDPNAWAYSLYEPFLPLQTHYGTLEKEALTQALHSLFQEIKQDSAMGTVQFILHTLVPATNTLCQEGLERCLAFTHGYGAAVWRGVLFHWIETLACHITHLVPTLSQWDEDGSDFQVGLRLLTLCHTLYQHFMDHARESQRLLQALATTQRAFHQHPSTPTTNSNSNSNSNSNNAQDTFPHASVSLLMSSVLNSAALERLPTEPTVDPSPALEALAAQCQRYVYDAVQLPMLHSLVDLWTEIQDTPPQDTPFSRSPSLYMTRIGEQLLMLPQYFEVYVDDPALAFQPATLPYGCHGRGEEEEVLQRWTTCVAHGTTEAFLEKVYDGKEMTSEQGLQLQTDMGYLVNVLAALEVSPLPDLLLVQEYMAWEEDRIVKALWAARKDPTKESEGLKRVAKIRGVMVLEL